MESERPCNRVIGGCQIEDLFQILSKAHMLDVLHTLNHAEEPLRFNEIQRGLRMSPNTLSTRLKELEAAGFVVRHSHNSIPPRVDYEATEKAKALQSVFSCLTEWAKTYDLEPMQILA